MTIPVNPSIRCGAPGGYKARLSRPGDLEEDDSLVGRREIALGKSCHT